MSLADALSKLTERLDRVLVLQSRFGGGGSGGYGSGGGSGGYGGGGYSSGSGSDSSPGLSSKSSRKRAAGEEDGVDRHPFIIPSPPGRIADRLGTPRPSPPSSAGSSPASSVRGSPAGSPALGGAARGSPAFGRVGGVGGSPAAARPPRPPPEPDATVGMEIMDGDTLNGFFVHSTDATAIPPEVLDSLPVNFENDWAREWYDPARGRCFEHQAPLDLTTIASYLKRMNAKILEDIIFMGIAIKIRCILKTFQGNKNWDHPVRELPANEDQQKIDLGICNSILHHFDSTDPESAHFAREGKYGKYEDTMVRSWCTMLISRYIIGESDDVRDSMRISNAMGMPRDRRGQLTVNAVIRGFRYFHEHDPLLMDEIFVLGCAGVCRGVVTCLLALRSRHLINPNGRGSDEIQKHFNRLNLLDFRNKLQRNSHYADPRNDLDKYYQMLCGIVHCKDFASRTQIFHNERYDRFFPVIRWEVLNLTLAFLVEYRDDTIVNYELQARLPGIQHMVKGPAHFFGLFPELATHKKI